MFRVGASYPHIFGVNSDIFKDEESETEAKTNSGHRVDLLLVGSPLFACKNHIQNPLFACYVCVYTPSPPHTHTHTYIKTLLYYDKLVGNS